MKQVVNIYEKGQRGLKALNTLGAYCHKSSVELSLQHLIYYRVSKLNGCAFCLDMHAKDLLAQGENVQRLLVLDAWRETTFYTERERAALAWAEALGELYNGFDNHQALLNYEQALALAKTQREKQGIQATINTLSGKK